MVGKQTSIVEMTRKYVGKPFNECSCMNLVHSWYTDLKIPFPSVYDGWTVKNYFQAWEKDKKGMLEIMLNLFGSLGEPVTDFSKLIRNDLLAVEEQGNLYAAIALGNNMAITSNINSGVRVFYLGQIHKVVLARRLTPCLN